MCLFCYVTILITLRTLKTTEMYVVNNGTFMYAKHGKLADADASASKPV